MRMHLPERRRIDLEGPSGDLVAKARRPRQHLDAIGRTPASCLPPRPGPVREHGHLAVPAAGQFETAKRVPPLREGRAVADARHAQRARRQPLDVVRPMPAQSYRAVAVDRVHRARPPAEQATG